MNKLEKLRDTIGPEATDRLLGVLTEKEKEALELGMTPKETPDVAPTDSPATPAPVSPTEPDADAFRVALEAALGPVLGKIATLTQKLDDLDSATKEAKTKFDNLTTKLSEVETTAKAANQGVTELKGDLPHGQTAHRASISDTTVTSTDKGHPGPDPQNSLGDFIGKFVLGQHE